MSTLGKKVYRSHFSFRCIICSDWGVLLLVGGDESEAQSQTRAVLRREDSESVVPASETKGTQSHRTHWRRRILLFRFACLLTGFMLLQLHTDNATTLAVKRSLGIESDRQTRAKTFTSFFVGGNKSLCVVCHVQVSWMRRWTDVTCQSSLTVMNLAVRPSPPDMCFLAVGLSQDLSSLYVQSTLAYLLRFLVMPDTAEQTYVCCHLANLTAWSRSYCLAYLFRKFNDGSRNSHRWMHGWVTVFGRVNHLGAEPGTQAYSAWARPLWQAGMSTRQKLGQ